MKKIRKLEIRKLETFKQILENQTTYKIRNIWTLDKLDIYTKEQLETRQIQQLDIFFFLDKFQNFRNFKISSLEQSLNLEKIENQNHQTIRTIRNLETLENQNHQTNYKIRKIRRLETLETNYKIGKFRKLRKLRTLEPI